jgi:hypothetical protein
MTCWNWHFDFGADVADEANRPDGIKLLRNFGEFDAITLVKDYLACNSHRHYSALCAIFCALPTGQMLKYPLLGKTGKGGDLIYSFPLNKLLENASHFIGKAPVMWEGRYMDLPLLGRIFIGN